MLPAPILPLSETALTDEAAAALGQDLGRLMENAGAAVAREALRLTPEGEILVACGPGNNGGDGYVAARILAEAGRTVRVWPVQPPASPLCIAAAGRLPAMVLRLDRAPAVPPALVVDAVLGAGTRGKPREPIASALAVLRGLASRGAKVLAVDVPSGLGSDLVLPADLALCLQVAKIELLQAHPEGEFKTVDIGIRPEAYQEIQPCVMRRFPRLKRTAHKGQHGELLIVGGGVFPGALEFAARAGVMTGCDLVRVWTAGTSPLPPTIVTHRQDGSALVPVEDDDLTALLVRASAVLIGPGLGRVESAHHAARQAFATAHEMGVPVVLDADGITATADLVRDLPPSDGRLILTPHGNEARTLLGGAVPEEAIHAFARPDRVILAKGVVDLVSDGRRWQRNRRGNPRMAVGGTGDVLAGLCAGLLARGCAPFDAARLAVLWTTVTGDACWEQQGPCYSALDVLAALPATLRSLLEPLEMWPPMTE